MSLAFALSEHRNAVPNVKANAVRLEIFITVLFPKLRKHDRNNRIPKFKILFFTVLVIHTYKVDSVEISVRKTEFQA